MLRHWLVLILLLYSNVSLAIPSFQLLMGFSAGVNAQALLDEISHTYSVTLEINRPLGEGYIVDVDCTRNQVLSLIDYLQDDPRVHYAELPPRLQVKFTPNEFPGSNQWYLTDSYGINAPAAWDTTRGDTSVVVALLDTGILPHADLQPGRMLAGYDFITDPATANDGDGRDAHPADQGDAVVAGECGVGEPAFDSSWHGLQVAGVAAATADNGIGIAGVDHRARLLPLRVLGKCGGDFIDVLEAMRWAAGLTVAGVPNNPTPADIINMSFSGTGVCSQPVQDVINEVVDRGVIIVAAAGNENINVNNQVPANCQRVIAVAATDRAGDRASYTNTGGMIDLAAPGGEGVDTIRTLSNSGKTSPVGESIVDAIGSSFSAAMVSGAAALLRAVNPALPPDEVLLNLQNGSLAFPPGSSCTTANCGAGILNIAQSLQLAASYQPQSNDTDASGGGGGGGGGGGCVLASGEQRAMDPLMVLFAIWLVSVVARQQSKKVPLYAR